MFFFLTITVFLFLLSIDHENNRGKHEKIAGGPFDQCIRLERGTTKEVQSCH